jgi:hypothetical protein
MNFPFGCASVLGCHGLGQLQPSYPYATQETENTCTDMQQHHAHGVGLARQRKCYARDVQIYLNTFGLAPNTQTLSKDTLRH